MTPIEAALEALDSLRPDEKPNFTQVAKEYGCSRTTLSRRYRMVQRSYQEARNEQRLLSQKQEEILVKYIKDLYSKKLLPTKYIVRNFARDIFRKEPRK